MQISDIKSSAWDSTASEYAKLPIQGPILIPCKRMIETMHNRVSFSSATAILDIGCGPGTAISLLIDDHGKDIPPEARMVATDYSEGMVAATRAKKDSKVASNGDPSNCWSRLETLVMDAQDLSGFPSHSVSHIMGSLVYFMLPDPRKGLREAHRVLQPGGVFACTSWAKVEWMELLVRAAHKVRPDNNGSPGSTGTRGPNLTPAQWKDAAGVKGEMESSGFRDVQTEEVEFNWVPEDRRKFADMMCTSSNPATEMLLGDLTGEEQNQVREEYMRILQENGNVCKGIAVLGVGRK
ncbi:S-adenosyl-L-methionine-dependent methyltransferase [Aspergillus bertholletiae]|uniref:S-adenosyl-L-methionine-dependent methyltransferase n=1 Tax=Aspergillus bertholletiae TaxID=1226010 RepID=A0A5N7BHZ4_9EURO|nr:S-adenosyl-L-methionine-dependent methyltransferase [Aspergillus bertholletiae]